MEFLTPAVMLWTIRVLGSVLLAVTVLPLIRSGKWFVRGWEMVRLQVAILLLVPIGMTALLLLNNRRNTELLVWLGLTVAANVWQTTHVIKFSPLWLTDVADAAANRAHTKIMIVNLKVDNPHQLQVSKEIDEEDPDVLMLVEINEAWKTGLARLKPRFPFRHDVIRDNGLGMALWSKLRILDAETRYLVSQRRPSIWATITVNPDQSINCVCVHPTPPGLNDSTGASRRDSRVRDAELVLVGREIAGRADESWMVAGDFNDVAWSHTSRLFKRISGLNDPRVGRTFMGTYNAQLPFLRCPFDHIFLSDGFALQSLTRKRMTGSDHFAVVAEIQLQKQPCGVQPALERDDLEEAEELVQEGVADARSRNVAER